MRKLLTSESLQRFQDVFGLVCKISAQSGTVAKFRCTNMNRRNTIFLKSTYFKEFLHNAATLRSRVEAFFGRSAELFRNLAISQNFRMKSGQGADFFEFLKSWKFCTTSQHCVSQAEAFFGKSAELLHNLAMSQNSPNFQIKDGRSADFSKFFNSGNFCTTTTQSAYAELRCFSVVFFRNFSQLGNIEKSVKFWHE